jgi:predicted regulator of Ras-like GTPase activity (Roadblock/LC7/MglB family)
MPKEYRDERLVRVLREQLFENVTGLQEAVIVTNDGLVVAAYPSINENKNANDDVGSSHWVAALAAEIIDQSRRAFGELSQGKVNRILIDGESGSMVVCPAGDHASLAVMLDNNAKLGLAMFQIVQVAEHVGSLLH